MNAQKWKDLKEVRRQLPLQESEMWLKREDEHTQQLNNKTLGK